VPSFAYVLPRYRRESLAAFSLEAMDFRVAIGAEGYEVRQPFVPDPSVRQVMHVLSRCQACVTTALVQLRCVEPSTDVVPMLTREIVRIRGVPEAS